VAVGIVIVVALATLAVVILVVGNESRMFSPKTRYTTNFRDVLGLKVGSPVYMSGVQVGSVEVIELPTDPVQEGITVTIAVDRSYAGRIRQGTLASLSFLQLLSGDKLIILTPGDPARPELKAGALIPPDETASFFEAGASAATNLSEITSKLNLILEPIQDGEGLLGRMVTDPDFGKEGLANINETFEEAKSLLESVNRGEGLLGQLIRNRELARKTLDSLQGSLGRFDALLTRVENNEGAIGSLLEEGGEGELAIVEARQAVGELRAVLEKVRNGQGLLSRFIYDEEFSRRIADDIERSTTSLTSILEKIDSGEGTLGGLVNDPAVYEGLENIVAGVNRSRLAKGFLRHYEKKGAKQKQKEREKQEEEEKRDDQDRTTGG
jgi:phospholipid/cholesterol/gamma-HCH transport system substrate-binding protein